MKTNRRLFIQTMAVSAIVMEGVTAFSADSRVLHYVRFKKGNQVAYGRLDGEKIRELKGSIFDQPSESGKTYLLKEVELLTPCEPRNILAVARNYASHLGTAPKPEKPELFFKAATATLATGGKIVIPPGTNDCHFEGELVVVIGKKAKNVSVNEAGQYIFGVTCGNDVSARDWQKGDIQWWRAKGSDTFAPLGPSIAVGAHYSNLLLTTRLNGEVKQKQRTSDLFFDVHKVVSFATRHLTLYPGDVIFTGTPGNTSPMKSGDVVEVEIEDIGILRNTIA